MMRRFKQLIGVSLLLFCSAVHADDDFIAFSFKNAEKNIKAGGFPDSTKHLGGITALAAIIVDVQNDDLIVLGKNNSDAGQTQISLDDWAVAMRAMFVHNEYPMVSLERRQDTATTGLLDVVWGGQVQGRYAADLLEADIMLKRIALAELSTEIWGLKSYFDRIKQQMQLHPTEARVLSRFWFDVLGRPGLAVKHGVVAIREMRVGVKAEIMAAYKDGKKVDDLTKVEDKAAQEFAADFSAEYFGLSEIFPEVARVKTLLDLIALARGLQKLSQTTELPNLEYWLSEYPISKVAIEPTHPLHTQQDELVLEDGSRINLEINGGVQLTTTIAALKKGSTRALKKAVLDSRPSTDALYWSVPLTDWNIPSALPITASHVTIAEKSNKDTAQTGTTIEWHAYTDTTQPNLDVKDTGLATKSLPVFSYHDTLIPQSTSNNVGGVLLNGVARIEGSEEVSIDLNDGGFALIVDGEKATLEPATFRKFITALWAVYFDKQDPGISLEPIGNSGKHWVRHIGNVINLDIARVMRISDYTMKKWALSHTRPNIKNFRDIDQLTAEHGLYHLGASRRLWFVPDNIVFQQFEGGLIFKKGHMKLKTEYRVQNKTIKAEPADEAFCHFFTENYSLIAESHDIYKQLFDYAKMVAMAKFLKKHGVPLFWFLMANKDLVLTEDSPGTVDELVKQSEVFRGIEIRGGVNLGDAGQYIVDETVLAALQKAVADIPQAEHLASMPAKSQVTNIRQNVSFSVDSQEYTALPQHKNSYGQDRFGTRYQTDLAIQVNQEPALELVRYYDPDNPNPGHFGNGWHLLVPYSIAVYGDERHSIAGLELIKKISVIDSITGSTEVLIFNADKYPLPGYVPMESVDTKLVGLFFEQSEGFRLIDLIGNNYLFDESFRLTDMYLSQSYNINYEYFDFNAIDFAEPPYQLLPGGEDIVADNGVRIPVSLSLVRASDGKQEDFVVNRTDHSLMYLPKHAGDSLFEAITHSNGMFVLRDKKSNQIFFDAQGVAKRILAADNRDVVRMIRMAGLKLRFEYGVDHDNVIRVQKATLSDRNASLKLVAEYRYDTENSLVDVIKRQPSINNLARRSVYRSNN